MYHHFEIWDCHCIASLACSTTARGSDRLRRAISYVTSLIVGFVAASSSSFHTSTTFGSFVHLVFAMLICFFFTYFKHHHGTLQAIPIAILGCWFHHIFIFVHHNYVARHAVSTLTLLHLLWEQHAASTSSLPTALHIMAVSKTFYVVPLK
jgi:hypothetical protein